MNIIDAMNDAAVFGQHFRKNSWTAWQSFLAALFALPMTAEQLAIYQECTSRKAPPAAPAAEGWLICGRRAGKSFVLALTAIFLACFKDWRPYLGPGEKATVMVVAADRKQARTIMRYCKGLLKAVPMLAGVIENETRESIDLRNSVTVEVHAASFRSTRGYSIVAALLDELAFWRQEESTDPDIEIINAIKPAMATIPGALMLCASSPYARKGALWTAFRRHHGEEGDPVLCWAAPTRTMNPTVPQSLIDQHLADDPARAAAEWLAEFRSDIESFVAREAVEACVSLGVRERPPLSNMSYAGFVDPSGGSSDSMTLAIAHREDNLTIIDCLRERRPPFSPEDVTAEFAETLKSYGISKVTGDRFGGAWPTERFDVHGINYEAAAKPKSDLYRDLLPAINSRQVDLLDDARLVAQLCGLERRVARGGRDSIDHGPGSHDDLANALAGVLCNLAQTSVGYSDLDWVGGPEIENWNMARLALYAASRGRIR
jgi:hypothetical protein